ncbi:hypothetical protein [Constantimarinum furrinae]|uniref:Uncharacterized protein n=1 Tax=Constantimarinum furrinae TaxID=2562285 RepID=A0A7G8PWM9_9FLAO|nr:hypothetical protein [Constantimarinum furrinae]QNJ98745.1 hypothetical protein ALE3EI_2200 [Constantimarinum furrinae]
MKNHAFPCPNCNNPLEMDIDALLLGRVIECTDCHSSMKLTKDHINSVADALKSKTSVSKKK